MLPDDQSRMPSFSIVRPPSKAKLPPIEPVPYSRVSPLPLCTPADSAAPPAPDRPPYTEKVPEPDRNGTPPAFAEPAVCSKSPLLCALLPPSNRTPEAERLRSVKNSDVGAVAAFRVLPDMTVSTPP